MSKSIVLEARLSKKLRNAICAQIVVFASVVSGAFAADDLQAQVEQEYRAGRYADALATINKMRPSSWTHYYSGLCYQSTSQLQKAKIEFAWVYRYSRNQTLKCNAGIALNNVSVYEKNRTYKGQGNHFDKQSLPPVGRIGGGFRVAY
jgi:hypothetical protein